jgi:death on curing protein
MKYLSSKEILILHARIIDATGGSHGVRDIGLLESITHKPQARFGGKDLYKNVFTKGAILLEAIVNYHVFIDGNKRTALVATARFLFINGYDLAASNIEAEVVVLKVATKKMDTPNLENWLRQNTQKISQK